MTSKELIRAKEALKTEFEEKVTSLKDNYEKDIATLDAAAETIQKYNNLSSKNNPMVSEKASSTSNTTKINKVRIINRSKNSSLPHSFIKNGVLSFLRSNGNKQFDVNDVEVFFLKKSNRIKPRRASIAQALTRLKESGHIREVRKRISNARPSVYVRS